MNKLLLATTASIGTLLIAASNANAQPVKPVAPGTIVVHLNGYLQFEFADFGSTYNTVSTTSGTSKLNRVTANGEFRLYPGFDAKTMSGIDYGVQAEIRTGFSDAGVGQNGGKPTYTSSTGTSSQDTLYVRRAYGYVGMPEYGYVRFGQTDGAFALLQNGIIENFGDGGQWKYEGGTSTVLPSNAAPQLTLTYADQPALYATDKLVILSPKYKGFSGAFSYEPNSNGLNEGYLNNTVASSTSAAESSSSVPSDIGRRRKNTIDGMAQYVLAMHGMTVKLSGGMLYGAPIAYDGTAAAATAAKATALVNGYDSLEVYQGGAQVTYAGLTLGANIKAGQALDAYAFKPKGARDALVYMVGGDYVRGPYVIGANYFNSQTAGTYDPTKTGKEARTLSEYGVIAAGNYIIGKDLSLFVQYMYGYRHQYGNAALPSGNAQVQVIALGATMKW